MPGVDARPTRGTGRPAVRRTRRAEDLTDAERLAPAIGNGADAARFHHQVASRVSDPEIRRLFAGLAAGRPDGRFGLHAGAVFAEALADDAPRPRRAAAARPDLRRDDGGRRGVGHTPPYLIPAFGTATAVELAVGILIGNAWPPRRRGVAQPATARGFSSCGRSASATRPARAS